MPLLRSTGHRAPGQALQTSSLAPRRLPSAQPVIASMHSACFASVTLFPAIVHYITRGQGESPDYPAFYITAFTLMPRHFGKVASITVSISLTLWRVYHAASQPFIPLHLLSFPPPSFPNTVPPSAYSSLQNRHLISQPAS